MEGDEATPLVILSSSSHTRFATPDSQGNAGPEVLGTLFQFVTTGKKNRGGHANIAKVANGRDKEFTKTFGV